MRVNMRIHAGKKGERLQTRTVSHTSNLPEHESRFGHSKGAERNWEKKKEGIYHGESLFSCVDRITEQAVTCPEAGVGYVCDQRVC
ncbi:hypothetical protein DdX_09244 [Ditylenchus destructor]|uniref:Uncharacterized protein n=1 Tax=Ditylenchus destructor TaxID=166010 RepID=A0AAD4N100_9BILA|nr:hypothetical protein DdX_09244 [Ditylenchus destructor]